MMSQTGKEIIIYIWHSISRSKGKQTITFGQLIEHHVRISFLENYSQNMMEKLVPDAFSKIKLSLSLDQ